MKRDDFTQQLPPIANNQMGVKPPLMFRGVSARFFPLRANLDILQQLCDSYLNIVPPEAGYFRAPLPYVYLVMLDYGEMGESVMRTGWFSQVEVYFGLTVEWYKKVRGQWVFQDWGVITPYIFVDDDFSVPTGRTVYGFPKILAHVDQIDSRWIKNPAAPVTLARIQTAVFPKAYSGTNIEQRVFLEIERTGISNLQAPFDPTSPMMPWTIAANLADAIGGLGRDAMWLAQAMRICPVNPFSDPNLVQQMAGHLPPWFAPGGKGFVLNSLNLKQFRRSEDPSTICYQALTNGCMQTTGFNGGGLLGEERVLLGELSGGHSIKLYEESSLPIVKTLGLEVAHSSHADSVGVSELKPIMPFWVNVDLKYYEGRNLAWRTDDGIWKDENGERFNSSRKLAPIAPAPEYNNTVSTAIEAIAGPFEFSDVTVRVLPLIAHKNKLQAFLDSYLNKALSDPMVRQDGTTPEEIKFEVWARPPQSINPGDPIGGDLGYVYLTATSFGSVVSKTNNVGNWAKYELAFMIPVQMKRKVKRKVDEEVFDEWEIVAVGLVPAASFVDDCIAAFSRLEIQGIETATANFLRPESVWLSSEGELADNQQTLLRVDVEVLSALGAGQVAKFQPVIEISRGAADAGLSDAPDAPVTWADYLVKELDQKKATKIEHPEELRTARALALELLGNQTPFSLYTLKQFRDVTDPDRACYQSLVRISRSLREVFDVREIEDTLVVHIHDYPSLQIAETLGLVSQRLDDNTSGIVYSVQPMRPFYVRATISEPLADRLAVRSGTRTWTVDERSPATPIAFQTLLSDDAGSPAISVDWRAETLQDQADPCMVATIMYEARAHRLYWSEWDRNAERARLQEHRPEQPSAGAIRLFQEIRKEASTAYGVMAPQEAIEDITKQNARDALVVIDPQTVIESVLSREWCNNDPNARWRQGKRELLNAFRALPQEGETMPVTEAELFRQVNNLLVNLPGAVAGMIPVGDVTAAQQLEARLEASSANPQTATGNTSDPAQDNSSQSGGGATTSQPAATIQAAGNDNPSDDASRRWRKQMTEILQRNLEFTTARLRMEQSLDILAPYAILGSTEMASIYRRLQKEKPTAQSLFDVGLRLLRAVMCIKGLQIEGEPSERNNLDPTVQADSFRLGEILEYLKNVFGSELPPDATPDAYIELARAHREEFTQLVDLSRRCCAHQQTAMLNKLSRAYQKPDFCIRRDALGAYRDQLLPLTFSWDKDWFYGQKINLKSGEA